MGAQHDAVRAKILKLCANDYLGTREIAEALGMSRNTIRAKYVYRMCDEGLLVSKLPRGHQQPFQAYKAAK
jgi:biotin operon repressor